MSSSNTIMGDQKFDSLKPLLERSGPFAAPGFEPSTENISILQNETRVLVVGAGGLGCEILKNLALSGFQDIHVIDLDTIDVSNLNRQFLFRKSDCGKDKANVAAAFIEKRCKGVKVTPHKKKIQEFPRSFYKKFDIVIAGLDNIEARQWLNETLVDLVEFDENNEIKTETVIPFIDGGTEGFSGQARVFIPRITACFECSISSMPEEEGHYHLCTLADVPRIPEHCIQYVMIMQWPLLEEFKSVEQYKLYEKKDKSDEFTPSAVQLDKDNIEHMTWIYRRAEERAQKFGIRGVTFHLTQQVVKRIIPAIASTNALISASCVNEALKFRTRSAYTLNNFFLYLGHQQTGTNSETFQYKRNDDCKHCKLPAFLTVPQDFTLKQLLEKLEKELNLDNPSLASESKLLFESNFASLYEENLNKPISASVKPGSFLKAFDRQKRTQKIVLRFS